MADPNLSSNADRRAQLLRAKLRGLLAARQLTPTLVTSSGLCAAVADGQAWVLDADDQRPLLGPAIAFALANHTSAVHVVAADDADIVARRAGAVRFPVHVWRAEGTELVAVAAAAVEPERHAAADHLALIDEIVAGGADPVVEHGVVTGEVDGLEVCRVVDDPLSGSVRLEVGVGAHDREMFAMLHGDRPTVEALAGVVATVRLHRYRGAEPHPLNLLASERSLRQRLIDDPALIGATTVTPAAPPVARRNIKDPVPCCAVAMIDDQPTTVVCSTGIDLDVVPFAADARAFHRTTAALIVVPRRDALAVQSRIGAALLDPIEIVGLAAPEERSSP